MCVWILGCGRDGPTHSGLVYTLLAHQDQGFEPLTDWSCAPERCSNNPPVQPTPCSPVANRELIFQRSVWLFINPFVAVPQVASLYSFLIMHYNATHFLHMHVLMYLNFYPCSPCCINAQRNLISHESCISVINECCVVIKSYPLLFTSVAPSDAKWLPISLNQ